MKTLINKILPVILLAVFITSCEKEGDKVFLTPGANMNLTSDKTTLVLEDVNANNPGIKFDWSKADFGFPSGTNYTLQLCVSGTNWAVPATSNNIDLGNTLTKSMKIAEFNQELVKFLPTFVASDIDVRIKASVGEAATPLYSNTVKVRVTPYRQLIAYSFPKSLNVAGNFQGWSPGTAPQLVDPNATATSGANYEGYIDFNNATPEFKLVRGNAWSAGDHGMASPGVLTANGGSNITLPSSGIYLLRANRDALTYNATKINSWAIVGTATPGGWGVETPMTYNPTTKTYSITVNLTGGNEMKFRANNDWAINFGVNNGKLTYGGSNIPIAQSGNYTITLDLLIGGNYDYIIKKN